LRVQKRTERDGPPEEGSRGEAGGIAARGKSEVAVNSVPDRRRKGRNALREKCAKKARVGNGTKGIAEALLTRPGSAAVLAQ